MRALVLGLCLAATGCYPPIDELVSDEPRLDSSRECSLPSEALGVAAAARPTFTAFPKLAGATHVVEPGGDVQAAVDAALPGDEIVLEAGAEYPGPLRLPYKSEPGTIVIRSSSLGELLEGRAVSIDDAPKLATILASDTDPAVIVEERAAGYRLAGLELRPAAGTAADALMVAGSLDSTLAEALPTELVVDRSLLRGDPALGARIGIELNVRSAAILDTRITDIKATVADAHGIRMDNAPGPILIHGSVIETSWRNVTIGERAPGSAELYPSDISICKSVLGKPAAWEGLGFPMTSLIRIARARRVLISGSLLDRSSPDAGPGAGLHVVDDGTAEGMPTEDIAVVDVRVRDVNMAFDINASGVTGGIARFLVENTEATRVRDRLFRVLGGGVDGLMLVHTTGVAAHSMLDGNGAVSPNLVIRDGLFDKGMYGLRGDGQGDGISTLDYYFVPWTVTHNIMVGASESSYPAQNYFPPTMFEAGVIDDAGGNYRLRPDSPYAGKASDGSDPGADIDRLEAALPAP